MNSLAIATGFANEISKISFPLRKFLAIGCWRQNLLAIANAMAGCTQRWCFGKHHGKPGRIYIPPPLSPFWPEGILREGGGVFWTPPPCGRNYFFRPPSCIRPPPLEGIKLGAPQPRKTIQNTKGFHPSRPQQTLEKQRKAAENTRNTKEYSLVRTHQGKTPRNGRSG